MDINSLLSPSEPKAPSRSRSSASNSTAGSKQQATLPQNYPKSTSAGAQSRAPSQVLSSGSGDVDTAPNRHQHASASSFSNDRTRSVTSNPAIAVNGAAIASEQRPSFVHRHSSGASAGASAGTSSGSNQSSYTIGSISSEAAGSRVTRSRRSMAPPNLRTLSNKSLATVTTDTAPARTPTPRNFSSNALSADDLSTVTGLLSYLNENSYAYDSHIQLISLLHKGFLAHSTSSADSGSGQRSPASYGLLAELRQAREAMDSRFAVGEALWQDWLQDEIALARSSEERIAVTELMQRAVQDEPSSTKLWQIYVDWLEKNYAACHRLQHVDAPVWSDEDNQICKELFTRQMLLDVLEQAAKAVAWRIDTSHVLWNKYLLFLQQPEDGSDAQENTATPGFELEKLFVSRLQTPHANAEDTLELFIPVIASLYKDNWETAISRFERLMEPSRKQLKVREAHESKIRYAIDTNDQQGLFEAFEQYLKWSRTHKHRGDNDKELRCSLFERALLHFPTQRDWWIAYIDYVISQQTSTHNPSASVLPLIERATRHCPWAGELWARRILRSDLERLSHDDIEACKHRATNSGLLDVGGMEDLLKVLVEWCSYLRRHAFTATATEDDIDTAEVGMTMALEDVQQAGRKLYGPDFQGDPLFRIEKIQIKFLSEARRMSDARNVWRSLVPSKKDSYEFWQQYHMWEITLWIIDRFNDAERIETTETSPKLATAVVEEAISQHNLDWPEKVHELYVNHFQWHESVERLQDATIVAWAFQQKIAAKRAKDANAAAAQQPAEAIAAVPAIPPEAESVSRDKRKREDDTVVDENVKKTKITPAGDQGSAQTENGLASADAQQKRDREHLSLTLVDLPVAATELDVRKFFRDCGEILSVALVVDKSKDSASAVVEFSAKEDVEAAKTRTGKQLLGRQVSIRSGSLSTLYVANYPADFDEAAVRKLFSAYGDIVSVRFPSLKYNNRRRFCYVQFMESSQASSAEEALDGKMLDGAHKLVAKISDPDAKKQRGGAQAEHRELFIKNIDNNVAEADVRAFFADYGNVLTINLLKNVAGRRLGNGFVVYSTAEEAAKAIEETHNKPLHDRILHVTLSQPRAGAVVADKAKKEDIIVKHGSPDTTQDRRGSDVSMASAASQVADTNDTYKTVRERQIAILDLPDTVSDARITSEIGKHGQIVKIQLRRQQNAAIVEFAEVKAAFAVRKGVDCKGLGPDTRTGDVKELFAKDNKKSKAKSTAYAMMPSQLGRPAVSNGRRGGLGFKRGNLGSGGKTAEASNGKAGRSNADFKSLFEKSRNADQAEQ